MGKLMTYIAAAIFVIGVAAWDNDATGGLDDVTMREMRDEIKKPIMEVLLLLTDQHSSHLDRLGRPRISARTERSILTARAKGMGVNRIARELRVGSSTVRRILAEVSSTRLRVNRRVSGVRVSAEKTPGWQNGCPLHSSRW